MDRKIKLIRQSLIKDILPTLETGDIILTSNHGAIVWFMQHFQKDPVHWGHSLIVKNSEEAWEASRRLHTIKLSTFFKHKVYWRIARKNDLSKAYKEYMLRTAPRLLGSPYGVYRIFLQLLDHIFHTNWFSSRNKNIYIQVCSSFVAWIYSVVCNYKFNDVPWMSCDPDDIEDDWEKHPDRWTIIAEHLPQED